MQVVVKARGRHDRICDEKEFGERQGAAVQRLLRIYPHTYLFRHRMSLKLQEMNRAVTI